MKTKMLGHIFVSVGLVFALAGLLAAGKRDRVPNFTRMARVSMQPTFTVT